MQVYAPRDPLAEYLAGRITLRKLRVMIEHLPPGSAWHRATAGPWRDVESLLWSIESRLRDLTVATHNASAVTVAAITHRQARFAPQPKYLPTPPPPAGVDAEPAQVGDPAERTELSALVHRRG